MKRNCQIIALLLLLAFSVSGCANTNQTDDSPEMTIYYAYNNNNNETGLSIGSEIRTIEVDSDPLKVALEAALGKPEDYRFVSPFPEGVSLLSYKLEKGTLALHMSDAYAEMPTGNKIIARSCLAMTLCAFDGVDNISVYVGDIPDIIALSAETIISENSELNPYIKRLKLYFSNGRELAYEYRDVYVAEDKQLAACVMEELMKGPFSDNLVSAMPAGTKLLSIGVENGICYVNMSSEFLDNKPDTEFSEALTIYSIVNSIVTLSKIDKVQFLINDERVDTYLNIGIFYPIEGKEINAN